ncbi:MAG: helix-turn-helix transcriptional regulator [Pseudomonadales bacterium]|nr:helix-turn-helix transcriptional regulator [Pseudomonadales bacterium]
MEKSIDSKAYIKLREWLIDARTTKNKLSIRELANKINEPHSFVHKIEKGRRKIDLIEFVRYCETLDVNPHEGLDLIIQHLR